MKTVKEFDITNKRVLVRCDFNVPFTPLENYSLTGRGKKGDILNDFRIKASLPTIEYLVENGAKVILMSHFAPHHPPPNLVGGGGGWTLKPVVHRLEELLKQKVKFLPDCVGKGVKKEIKRIKSGEVVLLENLRFHKGEKENSKQFAKKLASLADIYINNAFGVCHRKHASVVGVAKFLPSGAGFLLQKEIQVLSDVLENPKKPFVAIIGGVKIKTKIKVISAFLKKADHLLIGGKIAYHPILKCPAARQRDISKLVLPTDNKKKLDIGPKAIKAFSEIIKNANIIIWNGPMGKFENKKFENGTKKIAQAIAENKKAFKIAGGGETIEAIFKYGLENKFNHISTGGGAMLAFLAGEKLPGIEVLK